MPSAHAPAAKFEGHLLCILNGRRTDAPECAPSPPVERGKVARFLGAANTHHLNCRAWERQLLRTGQVTHRQAQTTLRAPLKRSSSEDVETCGYLVVSVPERSLHFGPRTSITTPLRSKGFGDGLSCSCTLKYASSRGHGNVVIPKGFPRSVGRVESQASWLSMLSILCHFHGLLWKRVSQSHNHREGPF
jgi:hypothetical protein